MTGLLPALSKKVPDSNAEAMPIRAVGQDTIAVSFIDTGASLATPQMVQRALTGSMAASQASGALSIVTGTTVNSEFLARSVENFRGAHIFSFQAQLSQRIVNQNFYYMVADSVAEGATCTINSSTSITVNIPKHGFRTTAVGQSVFVGAIIGAAGVPGYYAIASIPDVDNVTFTVVGWPASGTCAVDVFGYNHVKFLFNGTTATSAAFDASRRGWPSGDTTLTVNTSAAPGNMIQSKADGRNVYVSDTLVASTTTPNVVTRGCRVASVPDDNTDLYVYMWAFNGTVAPASTTTWTTGIWTLERFANLAVSVVSQRMAGSEAPQPVAVTNTPVNTIAAGGALVGDVGVQYRAVALGAASKAHIVSAATTNATSIKASAGKIVGWSLFNSSVAAKYVKFHNTASAPTPGAGVVQTIGIPAGGTSNFSCEGGIGMTTGIGLTITNLGVDADVTVVAVGDVIGDIFYA